MITAKEVRSMIKENLIIFFSEHGFKYRKHSFTKYNVDFNLTVFYSLVTGDHEFPTSFSFWVESKLIDRILKKAFNETIEQNSSTVLLALSQSIVFKMKPKEFMINSIEDVEEMCNKVKWYLEMEGFSFFKEYQDYKKILNEMKSTPFGLFYGQGFVTWSQNALVLSKLLDDSDYETLYIKYMKYCQEYNLGDYLTNRLKTLNDFLKNKNSKDLLII